ncbi:DUF134 domain-containing protein [Anaerosinus gibii]|uniref:UPF0251 protein P3F81_12655 n=1 Tax=Selenobaculum gibii TaxID=3054208 RepID=A0A9Y2AJQ5_9FIRM|nr:DUF134 domain-containing protein [Selenobaculum gbiensis]WIW70710.1 DUF134 domain-containing protein [Selenobaculum gbiensis]
MARPQKERMVEKIPKVIYYKPAGIPLNEIKELSLTIEQMESIRLIDIELLDQATAAEKMNVSRPTFNRILNKARQIIALALWQGAAIRIEGGNFQIAEMGKRLYCNKCGYTWEIVIKKEVCQHMKKCPHCEGEVICE